MAGRFCGRLSIMAEVIQGLWIGGALSAMERLSIASFLGHGHEFHLYAYGEVAGVPQGTILRDAGEILPASRIFYYPRERSCSGFSNLFRYRLLLERGGWWVDVDMVCLEPFDFSAEYVFSSEPVRGGAVPTSGLLKVPAGSAIMAEACEICERKDPSALAWGETGPRLIGELLPRHALAGSVQAPEVFCPVPCNRWRDLLDPGIRWQLGETTRTVHLWRQMWRRAAMDTDGDHLPGCLYEQLKARYL